MSYIRSADAALYYEEYGTGENLILLPGPFGTIDLEWRRFIPPLAGHFHTIAVDLRGHGRTNNPSSTLRPEQVLSDLRTFFDTLEISSAYLCANEHVGMFALQFALRNPGRILGLILHSPCSGSRQRPASSYSDEILQRAHAHANGPDGWKVLLRESPRLFASAAEPDPADLSAFRVPVLVAISNHCDADEMAGTEQFARAFGICAVVRLQSTGRGIGSVNRDELVDAVIGFSSRSGRSGPAT